MIIKSIIGPTGSGKSFTIRQRIAANKGKYLVALSRVDAIREFERDYIRDMPDQKMIHAIYSGNEKKGPVTSQIEELPRRFETEDHLVVFITHEGLMQADLSGFAGWHLVIDENINGVLCGNIKAPVLSRVLPELYALQPSPLAGWHDITAQPDNTSHGDILHDDACKVIASLDKCVRGQYLVRTDVEDWKKYVGKTDPIRWYGVWSLYDVCVNFASITVAGADLSRSLLWKAMLKSHSDKITVEEEVLPSRRKAPVSIRIFYFTDSHKGSTEYWKSKEGRKCIEAIGHHLANLKEDAYWSANDSIAPILKPYIKGRYVKPKQEGSNSLTGYRVCVFIYSAKATLDDEVLQDTLGLTDVEITDSREHTDIHQLANRGGIRDPNFTGDYDIYLYSKDQAEALKAEYEKYGIGTVTLEPVLEAGIMDVKRKNEKKEPKAPRKSKDERDAERREKNKISQRKRRAKKKAEENANGTARVLLTPQEKKKRGAEASRKYREKKKQLLAQYLLGGLDSTSPLIVSIDHLPHAANSVCEFVTMKCA